MLFKFTKMKTLRAHLFCPQPNMSFNGEWCNSLSKTSLTSFVGNHLATSGLQVNLSTVKGGAISSPLFLLEENAILSMTAKAGCGKRKLQNPPKKTCMVTVIAQRPKMSCCSAK